MQVHCLHWLMSTDLLFGVLFANHVNSQLLKWHQCRAPIWQWRPDTAPTVSIHICLGLVVEYWPLWVHVDITGTLNPTICVILLLCFSLCHHHPTPAPFPFNPLYVYAEPILMHSMKNHQKLVKIGHYLLARLVIQKLIDN